MAEIKNEEKHTRRIIINSFLLFFRMLFVSFLSLYSVRFVLQGLGIEGYGTFNAISGIVLTGTFIIPVLATSIQRFYSFALGKNDKTQLENLFSVSCNIILLLILAFFLLFETIGLWYINSYLVIPDSHLHIVNTVYQISLFSFLISILQVPFTAIIISHEQMEIYAALSCTDCLLKFLLAFSLSFFSGNTLVYYSIGLLSISLFIILCYSIYSFRSYEECHYKKVEDKSIYRSLITFSGWTTIDAVTGTTTIQGSVIILNFFFGSLANAAFGVANNLYNAINSLANSVILSFRPAMIKFYAQEEYTELNRLFNINNKLALYLMGAFIVPVLFEMEFILKCWLGDITHDMVLYSQLFSIYTLLMVMHNPITNIVQSTGKIKEYTLLVNCIMLLSLPISISLFYFGSPSYLIFIVLIGCCTTAHIARLYCLKKVYSSFSVGLYLQNIVIRGLFVFALSILLAWYLHGIIADDIIRFFTTIIITPFCLLVLAFVLGLSTQEKKKVIFIIKTKRPWHI